MSRFSCPNRAGALLSILLCACVTHALAAADTKALHANLTAAQIIEKHVAARGGLQALRAIQTLSVTGTMDAGSGDSLTRSERIAQHGMGAIAKKQRAGTATGAAKDQTNQQVQLPFTLELKRPHKSRLEIQFAGTTAVQVFDGTRGWKLRPYLNRNDVAPFTDEEAKASAEAADMDDVLVDYAAKETKVEVAGVEPVEGHEAYKLKLTTKDGKVQHIWIDAQSFLDVKVEGIPRRMDGRMHAVWIYQRDFRSVQGMMMPFVYETAVEGYTQTHKMNIQTMTMNRTLDDSRFTKAYIVASVASAAPPATPAAVNH